jgi:class 3 adenylate cyclase
MTDRRVLRVRDQEQRENIQQARHTEHEEAVGLHHYIGLAAHQIGELGQRLDRLQHAAGDRVGIAGGHLNLLPLRTFSRLYFTFIGDSLNRTSWLMNEVRPSEIVISNSLDHSLSPEDRTRFEQDAHVEAKNVGLIRCWRWPVQPQAAATAGNTPRRTRGNALLLRSPVPRQAPPARGGASGEAAVAVA